MLWREVTIYITLYSLLFLLYTFITIYITHYTIYYNLSRFMITKDAIESAFCFFHQKQRIYQYSTLDWQKDDIEYAIGDYVDNMNKELYSSLAKGKPHFLHSHTTFAEELLDAVETLERMLE